MDLYILDICVDEKAQVYPVMEFNFEKNNRYRIDGGYTFPRLSRTEFSLTNDFLPAYQLAPRAVLKDVISGAVLFQGEGLYISSRMKELILQLNTPPVKFYPL